jgi:general L-amino acid transport system substrate-binding protein
MTTDTLTLVQDRGHVRCGVGDVQAGFAETDATGRWRGMDIDLCSALAAAVLGDKAAVTVRSLAPIDRLQALARGDVDVLSGGVAWDLSRDSGFGVVSVGVFFYDGIGLMVPRGVAVTSILELSGSSLCVQAGTRAEPATIDYFERQGMRTKFIRSDSWDTLVQYYATGACAGLIGDTSDLAISRSRMPKPLDHAILPEVITKEPHGPAVRPHDSRWFTIVRWTMMAMIAAEELGITQLNASAMRASRSTAVRRFLGLESNLGQGLGLREDWPFQVIQQVGNYAEVFDRNLGEASPLRLPRGLNELWTKGGLHYAFPFR